MMSTLTESQISKELIQEYLISEYRIGEEPDGFTLRIGEYSDALVQLFSSPELECALFITAYNPFSLSHSVEENESADERLKEDLARHAASFTVALGINPAGEWPGEPGYLALGLDRESSCLLGRKYRQNAVVWVGADALPQLLLLR